jgi:hypothetical protein
VPSFDRFAIDDFASRKLAEQSFLSHLCLKVTTASASKVLAAYCYFIVHAERLDQSRE